MKPDISVIITARNEVELKPTVKCVLDTANGAVVEIIVIDDSSEDGCAEGLHWIDGVKVFHVGFKGVGVSRTFGINQATADRFIILDAHMKFTSGWIQEYIKAIDENSPCIICCRSGSYEMKPLPCFGCHWIFEPHHDNLGREFLGLHWDPLEQEGLTRVNGLMGACYGISRATWELLPGLPARRGYGQDEEYLGCGAGLLDIPIILLPHVIAYHQYRGHTKEQPARPYACDRNDSSVIMRAMTQIMFDDMRALVQQVCFGYVFDDSMLTVDELKMKERVQNNRKFTDKEWLQKVGILKDIYRKAKEIGITTDAPKKIFPDLYAFIQIKGRPEYTRATLESLSKSSVANRLLMNVIICPTDDLGPQRVREMLYEFKLRVGEIIEDDPKTPGPGPSAHTAFMRMREAAKSDQWERFLWIENDVLFRHDWYERTMEFEAEMRRYLASANHGKRLGLIFPNHFHNMLYKPQWVAFPWTESGKQHTGFWIKARTSSQIYVMTREVIRSIDLDADYWKHDGFGWDEGIGFDLTEKHFWHFIPDESFVKHIGMHGQCWGGRDWLPSVGFEHDAETLNIYEAVKCL